MRVVALVAGVLALGGGAGGAVASPAVDPVVAAAGDISCDPDTDPSFNGGNGTTSSCHMAATAALLAGATAVLPLGDLQYEDGTFDKFTRSYALSWGAHKPITRPAVGNHEYLTPGAAGYFDYFNGVGVNNGPAGERGKGYYSFDLGTWHLIALNSDIADGPTSEQLQWLRTDLGGTTQPCILAYWHKPRFSSGVHGGDPGSATFWQELYARRADVVLNGHDHIYERFALQDPNAVATAQGLRQFTVGTGGKNHTEIPGPGGLAANSQVRSTGTYGVLKLTLRPNSYHWEFVPEGGGTLDSGDTDCHAGPTSVRPAGCRAGYWVSGRRGGMRYVCLRRWRAG